MQFLIFSPTILACRQILHDYYSAQLQEKIREYLISAYFHSASVLVVLYILRSHHRKWSLLLMPPLYHTSQLFNTASYITGEICISQEINTSAKALHAVTRQTKENISETSHVSSFLSRKPCMLAVLSGCKLKSRYLPVLKQLNRLRFSPKPKKTFFLPFFFFLILRRWQG